MSRHDNHVNRKLRGALHRMRVAQAELPPSLRLPVNGPMRPHAPMPNFYARVSDGWVRLAVAQRPPAGLVWNEYETQKRKNADRAAAEKARRLAEQKKAFPSVLAPARRGRVPAIMAALVTAAQGLRELVRV
jgi:hypothetical protein